MNEPSAVCENPQMQSITSSHILRCIHRQRRRLCDMQLCKPESSYLYPFNPLAMFLSGTHTIFFRRFLFYYTLTHKHTFLIKRKVMVAQLEKMDYAWKNYVCVVRRW